MFCQSGWATVRLETAVSGGDAELRLERRVAPPSAGDGAGTGPSVWTKLAGCCPLFLLFTRNVLGYMKLDQGHWKYLV